MELLEDRSVPAPLLVTDFTDFVPHSGYSLRDAVARANVDAGQGLSDIIHFQTTAPQEILLQAPLELTGTGTITIDSGGLITVIGGEVQVDAGADVVLSGLALEASIVNNGTLTATNCTFSANGGVVNSNTLTVSGSTFSGNSAGDGGAIDNFGLLAVAASTFSGNSATGSGGAIFNEFGTATVSACTFSGNSAGNSGGAIDNLAGNLTVSDSTLSGNSAATGGGIFSGAMGTCMLLTTIVAKNTADQADADIDGSAGGSYNLIGDGTGLLGIRNGDSNHNQVGTTARPIDPMLAPLSSYGGPTPVMPLLAGSPALNAGGPLTLLTSDISPGAATTSFSVADTAAFAASAGNLVLQIDGEQILANRSTSNTFTIVERGYNGTVPAAHFANKTGVFLGLDQRGQVRVATGQTDIGAVSHYLVVTTSATATGHSGESLPDMVALADLDAAVGSSDTILFTPGLNGQTIQLAQALELSGSGGAITLDGGGQIAITGSFVSRVFQIDAGLSAFLQNLTIEQGNAGGDAGGGILNSGSLTVSAVTISQCAAGFGGGIANYGLLTLSGSMLSRNLAASHGGAILNDGTMTIRDSTLAENAAHFGGAVANDGSMFLSYATISVNTAAFGGGVFNDGTLTLATTVIAKNTALNNADLYGTAAGSFNLIGNGDMSGLANAHQNHNQVGTPSNPLQAYFAALGNYGGPTRTLLPNPGSPTLKAGGPVTSLIAALTSESDSVTFSDGSAIAVTPDTVLLQIDDEQMLAAFVLGSNNQSFTILKRGYNGTSVAAHDAGAGVFLAQDQRGYPRVANDQTTIGAVADVPALVINNPDDVTVTEHQNAAFSSTSSNPTASVQWQVSSMGGSFTNIAGATSASLILDDVLRGENRNEDRAVFSNTAGTFITQAARLTVLFVTGPADRRVDAGQTATFKAACSDPRATVQWQSSKDDGGSYSNIPGATRGTLLLRSLATSASGILIRAVFTATAGIVYSTAATLQVNALPTTGVFNVTQGTVGTMFTGTMPIMGGSAPFTITAYSGLPPGATRPLISAVTVSLPDGSTKDQMALTLTFTPTKPGTFKGTVSMADKANARFTTTFTITIVSPGIAAQTLTALTDDSHLLTFRSNAPGKITRSKTITGLAAKDSLHALAFAPDGTLYGISFDHLYTLNPATGAATILAGPSLGLYSADVGLAASFDPLTAELRVLDDVGDSEVIYLPGTGAAVVDHKGAAPLFVTGDVNHGALPLLTAAAYTGTGVSTTLYSIADVANSQFLVTIGGVNGEPSADSGAVHTIAAITPVNAFTIGGPGNTAYALGGDSERATLWTVNLMTGDETRVGGFGSAATIISLAAMPG